MRRIQTKAIQDRKKRLNNILLGIVMIALLTFSTAGFALFSKDDETEKEAQTINVNGYTFQKQDNAWLVQINDEYKAFYHLPTEIEDVPINITNEMLTYVNQPLYLINAENAKNQIDTNLLPNYVLRTQNACIDEEECTGDYPTKNCAIDNVIIYKDKNSTTNIYQENNCIYITGDQIKGTDKFLQKIFQIA
jgi:hypothetical protein